MNLKAVILDFGGTLAKGELSYPQYHEAILSYLRDLGYELDISEIRSAIHSSLNLLEEIRSDGREQTFEEVYSHMLDELKVPKEPEILEDLHKIFREYYNTEFFSCTEEVLRDLSSRYRLAMLSNTMSDKPKLMLIEEGWDGLFDVMVCSRDLGVRKPNPEIFRYVLGELGVKADEAVHVGDRLEADIYGAKSSGVTPIWIKGEDEEWGGYSIDSICELPQLLREING